MFALCEPIVIGVCLNPGQKLFDPKRPTFWPDDLRLPIFSSEFSTLQQLVIVLLIHRHSTSYNAPILGSYHIVIGSDAFVLGAMHQISYIIEHYIFLVIFIGSDAYIGDHVCSIFWAIYFGGHQSPTDIVQQRDFNLEITFVTKKSRKKNPDFYGQADCKAWPPPPF